MFKHVIHRFLITGLCFFCLIIPATLYVHATEDGGEAGADGGEMIESTGDPSKLPYAPGDRPVYVYAEGGYITGYFVIHIDATYTSMSKDQYETYAKKYCEATGTEYFEPFGEDIDSSYFAQTITEQAEQYYSTNIEVAHAVAREINNAKLIPENIDWFTYVPEEDGEYHYYRSKGLYYKVNDEVYNAYLALDDNVYDHDAATAGLSYGASTGTVFIYVEPSESLKTESLYITFQDKETLEETTLYLNPPTFNDMITLQYGTYEVIAGGLYADRGFPVDMNPTEFTVVEGQSIEVRIPMSVAGESVELTPYTEEEMAAINQQYADSRAYMTGEVDEVSPAEFITDESSETPKNGKTFWIVMGVAAVIIVSGTFILIRRRQSEDY